MLIMADKFRYVCTKPARLLYSNVTVKSAPRGVVNAEQKFSATFGVEKEDFDAIVKLEVEAIRSETGGFTNPSDYYLACTSGETAAKRVLAKAALDAQGKPSDEAMKINERAEQRAALYRQYAGIMTAASKFDVEVAKLENGKIVDIDISTDANRAVAQRDFFYGGAYVAPAVAFQGYRRKTLDAKDGVTAFLQNVMFIHKGDKIGGLAPSNKEVFGGFSDYDPTMGGTIQDDLHDDIAF
jgi:hypothetical protein